MRLKYLAIAAACAVSGLASAGPSQAGPTGLGVRATASPSALTRVEYFCSPGFEPSYGGTCVAVPSRAEVEVYVEQPIYDTSEIVHHEVHRRHRRGMRERF